MIFEETDMLYDWLDFVEVEYGVTGFTKWMREQPNVDMRTGMLLLVSHINSYGMSRYLRCQYYQCISQELLTILDTMGVNR